MVIAVVRMTIGCAVCMAVHGCAWHHTSTTFLLGCAVCMAVHGCAWLCMAPHVRHLPTWVYTLFVFVFVLHIRLGRPFERRGSIGGMGDGIVYAPKVWRGMAAMRCCRTTRDIPDDGAVFVDFEWVPCDTNAFDDHAIRVDCCEGTARHHLKARSRLSKHNHRRLSEMDWRECCGNGGATRLPVALEFVLVPDRVLGEDWAGRKLAHPRVEDQPFLGLDWGVVVCSARGQTRVIMNKPPCFL